MNNPAANDSTGATLDAIILLERLQVLQSLIVTELSIYYGGENNPHRVEIENFMQATVGILKMHTVFTEHQLESLVNKVFTSVQLRDFVLCITDKFNILYSDGLINNTIARGVSQTLPSENETNLSLIPEHILSNMQVSEVSIRKILEQNKWLCTIILMHLAMTILTDKKPIPEKVKPK